MTKQKVSREATLPATTDRQFALSFDGAHEPTKPSAVPIATMHLPKRASNRPKRSDTPTRVSTSRPLAVTIKDACAHLGVGRTTVYALMEREKLAWQKIGARRVILFSSIEELLGISEAPLKA